jgi:hypothetical protein
MRSCVGVAVTLNATVRTTACARAVAVCALQTRRAVCAVRGIAASTAIARSSACASVVPAQSAGRGAVAVAWADSVTIARSKCVPNVLTVCVCVHDTRAHS